MRVCVCVCVCVSPNIDVQVCQSFGFPKRREEKRGE